MMAWAKEEAAKETALYNQQKDSGYIPSYKRTKLTDSLHNAFDFRTDFEFVSKSTIRTIIAKTKKVTSTKTKI